MRVVFLSPHFPHEMPQFTRGLAEVGAEVWGLADAPQDALPQDVRRHLAGYLRVSRLLDEERTLLEVLPDLQRLRPDRIECLWEVGVVLAARLREALGVPGQSVEDAMAFRDKELMKQRLDRAGLRVPHHAKVRGARDAVEAAERIGFPIIIKPIDGAGTRDTFRVDSMAELQAILPRVAHVAEASVEEFIDGEEFTYDTVAVDSKPVFESIAQYHPKPLIARNEQWVSPAQVLYRTPHQPAFEDAIAFGRQVLLAMGRGTGFSHMEWFRKPTGEIVFGEIAARAPGGRLVDQMNIANDFDVCREWARTVCWRSFEGIPQRRYHVTCVFKRAHGEGRIRRIEGLEDVRRRLGSWLVSEELLPVGSWRRDWKQTLLSDGCLIARHPDYATCIEMQDLLVRGVRMLAG
ncbi:MAG: ATP-grasp domain-containing protein [Myxococcales bacterium]|nr:ATP-grasp domain-containing protein [Myxococcales bacterium]